MVSPQIRREQVLLACQRGLSQRHACGLIGIGRSALSYQARLPAKDAPVIAAMKVLSAQYPRYGYRRIRIFLRRQGFELGWSRTHRLWRQAGLLLPAKRARRRIASNRPRAYTPIKANAVWAYDFVFDTTAQGQQIKCLTVIDEYTRECLAIDVAGSIRSRRVVEVLSRLVTVHGAPLFMRSDNVLNAIGLSKNGNSIPCRFARTNRHRTKSNEQVLQQSSASLGAPVNHSGNKIPGCDQPDLYRT